MGGDSCWDTGEEAFLDLRGLDDVFEVDAIVNEVLWRYIWSFALPWLCSMVMVEVSGA